jgi:imidazolonepropionase
MMDSDLLIHSAKQLVTCASHQPKRGAAMLDVGMIEDGAVVVGNGEILAVGTTTDLGNRYQTHTEIDASGKVVCPGFVDSHTHVVYAGDRINEFEMRIKGATYMEIMAAGGGIVSTMHAVRAASLDELVAQSRSRLDTMLRLGTTAAEVKSGYGLDYDNEIKMLEAIEILDEAHPIDLIPTFLGAHAIPPGYEYMEDYEDEVINIQIPDAADWYKESTFAERGIPLFVDVFCEQNAFNLRASQRILKKGQLAGMLVKAHVDEFTSLGGVSMAVELGAVSVDHLDVTTPEEIALLAKSNTIGVVIPAVNFNLGSHHFADARAMIDAGVALALATDINPGSAPCPSMPLVMAIACRYQKLLPAEALNACTINAAYAIGMGDRVGSIEVGKQADILIVNAPDYRHLAYQFGGNLVEQVIKRGKIL